MADLVPVSVVGTPSIAEDMPYDFYITATNLFNSYSNDMLTVKLSGFPDMHWEVNSTLLYYIQALVTQRAI